MGKKPAVKAKAKAKAAPEPEPQEEQPTAEQLEAKRLWQQRREATKWAQAQLEVVRGQLEAAQKRKNCDWLQVAHEFHEKKLIKVLKRLEEKALDALPQELRDGVERYLKQFAGGATVEQDGFKEEKEIWDLVDEEAGGYKRKEETPQALEAIEQLKAWSGTSVEEIAKLVAAMKAHAESAGVQEAGLTRIGFLFSEAQRGADSPGLTCAGVMPAIDAAMNGHAADIGVQKAGCAALRGLAMAPGQLPLLRDAGGIQLAVAAVCAHYKDKELALSANGAFWAMAQAAGKNSPEVSTMREAKVVECLLKVMTHHAWDQTLCGKIRVTLPFIAEE